MHIYLSQIIFIHTRLTYFCVTHLQLAKQQQIQSSQHDTLLLDQVTLRTLHEQLSLEYEQLKQEQEALRKLNRDLRSEIRSYKENISTHEKKINNLEQEKEALNNESKSLSNLRAEHSKLKVGFWNKNCNGNNFLFFSG